MSQILAPLAAVAGSVEEGAPLRQVPALSPVVTPATLAPISNASPLSAIPVLPEAAVQTKAELPDLHAAPAGPAAAQPQAIATLRAGAQEIAQAGPAPEGAVSRLFAERVVPAATLAVAAVTLLPAKAIAAQTLASGGDGGWKAAGATTILAAAGGLFGWLKKGREVPRPDAAATGELLAKTSALRTALGFRDRAALVSVDAAAESIFSGQYAQARGELAAVSHPQAAEVSKALPAADHPQAAAARAALKEVLSDLKGDPFQLQAKLERLVGGLVWRDLPQGVKAWHLKLTERASHQARARGAKRPGAAAGGKQAFNDCVVRALYALPVAGLDALRKKMTYEQFLAEVDAKHADWRLMERGVSMEGLQELLGELGLKGTFHVPTGDELAELVRAHGAVLGSVVWYDKDVSALRPTETGRFMHQHAIVIKSVSADGKEFTVLDSLYDRELRYTAEELGLQALSVLAVEPAL